MISTQHNKTSSYEIFVCNHTFAEFSLTTNPLNMREIMHNENVYFNDQKHPLIMNYIMQYVRISIIRHS